MRRQTRAVVALLRASAGRAHHFVFMEDDFILCPHAIRAMSYLTTKALAYFPGPVPDPLRAGRARGAGVRKRIVGSNDLRDSRWAAAGSRTELGNRRGLTPRASGNVTPPTAGFSRPARGVRRRGAGVRDGQWRASRPEQREPPQAP